MSRTRLTKTEKVKRHLERGNKITSMQAFKKFNATRLSAIIFELRNRHKMDINTQEKVSRLDNGKYAEYYLA